MGDFRISEEHRRRISEGMQRNYQSPAFCERQKRRTREALADPEVKVRQRQGVRDWWVRRKAEYAANKQEQVSG